jgi:hypothetical protein
MFSNMAKQLQMWTPGKSKKSFTITKQEFEDFCKEFLFEEIKGDTKLGPAFCEKYGQTNYILSILGNNSAREHIKTFYLK